MSLFLSTLSLRRATYIIGNTVNFHPISIHALLAESDIMFVNLRVVDESFLSTLSLRRATSILDYFSAVMRQFLSTLSLRRATNSRADNVKRDKDFYPRSPCGERPLQV